MFRRRLGFTALFLGLVIIFLGAGLRSEGLPANFAGLMGVGIALLLILVSTREMFLQLGKKQIIRAEVNIPGALERDFEIRSGKSYAIWVFFPHSFNCFQGMISIWCDNKKFAERNFPESNLKITTSGLHPAFRRGARHCLFRASPKASVRMRIQIELFSIVVRPSDQQRLHLRKVEQIEIACVETLL